MESKLQNFEILNKLGSGAYSQVYKVQRKSDGKLYALKKVKLIDIGDREKQNALNEVRFIASIHHENVVSYKECFIEDNNLCIIMEYAEGGDLLQKIQRYVKKQQMIPEQQIWQAAIQVLQGLRALHHKKILHRDLKCANIFLYDNDHVKLGDFNVSKLAKNGLVYTQTGTPYYASPEVWQDKPYDHKADLWSLGCVIYEMCALKPPFRAKDMDSLYKSVLRGQYQPIPVIYSQELVQLIKSMMQVQPSNRPDSDKLLQFSFIQKKAKLYGIPLINDEIEDDLLKTIKWPITRKGLQTNKSELINLNCQLPGSNYLNQHNSNHIKRKDQSNRIRSQDTNDSISVNQPNEALHQLMKQITQLDQKEDEKTSNVNHNLNKSIQKQAIQENIQPIDRRLRVSNSTHEKHERYESNQQSKCASKDRLDHQIQINSNYYAKDVIQSLNKQHYSQKLPIISGIQKQGEEYILRKNSSNERNSSSYLKRSQHETQKKDLSIQPSAERPTALMKIIEEHQQLPKIKKKY
ncbi:unnamed protein product (macronuclear) [Paramecium tetraurelia]|uniref:non-specific serine/threonine protein kinase n=1 Tax=Paramecium tetraurelia TaxID=5888 RepID=A0CGI0_PARTE|nr:uncharacterized protein GSPATT00007337001 [Paramecium tetraurelia]CAK69897.1 unnamed protein product [Paramecium tetraurelia]|eukprot:XP_001437294.1 hypothetical protein (macronuclear) [Paramecium tetraurelia strain d4-2]